MRQSAQTMGKPADFTPEDVALFRDWTRRLLIERGWSMTDLANQVEIEQQNISRFIGRNPIGGPSRVTMDAIAALADFRDSRELLTELQIGEAMQPKKGNVWSARDSAKRIAKLLEHSDSAIEAVVARCSAPEYAKKDVRWWVDEIVIESLRMNAGRNRQ